MPIAGGPDVTPAVLRGLADIVGAPQVLTGDAAAGYAVDWTGRFRGATPAVVRPADTAEVAAVLARCTEAGLAVVPQGGNTGLVGGGVPLHGEVVLSLARLTGLGAVDPSSRQVTAGAGVTLAQVGAADPGTGPRHPHRQPGQRHRRRCRRHERRRAAGPALRADAVPAARRRGRPVRRHGGLAPGGLVKDNTGYDYPSLLAGSEGTLAVVTRARLQLVPRPRDPVTALVALDGPRPVHDLAVRALTAVPGLLSAEFLIQAGLDLLIKHAGLRAPWPAGALPWPDPAYLLLEAAGPGALDDLATSSGTGPPRWRSPPPTGSDCGPTGNASRRRPASSAPRSSWT